mmetsp:Transcript_146615/g.470410  ORF Transcript_146615/g.470410 Transcript_146615/m.470410 type:complete len:224 (-) Transcript_146615:611-1282(-)
MGCRAHPSTQDPTQAHPRSGPRRSGPGRRRAWRCRCRRWRTRRATRRQFPRAAAASATQCPSPRRPPVGAAAAGRRAEAAPPPCSRPPSLELSRLARTGAGRAEIGGWCSITTAMWSCTTRARRRHSGPAASPRWTRLPAPRRCPAPMAAARSAGKPSTRGLLSRRRRTSTCCKASSATPPPGLRRIPRMRSTCWPRATSTGYWVSRANRPWRMSKEPTANVR